MDLILIEFEQDLERVLRLVSLLDHIKEFAGAQILSDIDDHPFIDNAKVMHKEARTCHTDVHILPGTLLLYLGGRFEYYIRTIFEDLCIRIATKSGSFNKLPKIMQENLVKFTAEVMANPRKYGHGDKGVKAFIATLASNLSESQDVVQINAACLSITYENMRAATLSELFERIGIKDLWQKIGQQAKVQIFFETGESEQAKNKAMASLNVFVDLRNQIAHPAGNIFWPDTSKVIEYIEFLKVLSSAVAELVSVYEIQLTTNR